MTVAYIISQVVGWLATFLRAGGMLAKDSMRVKLLVSGGNALWLFSGILTGNAPLIASNAICLVVMAFEIIKNRKDKNGPKTPRTNDSQDGGTDKPV